MNFLMLFVYLYHSTWAGICQIYIYIYIRPYLIELYTVKYLISQCIWYIYFIILIINFFKLLVFEIDIIGIGSSQSLDAR